MALVFIHGEGWVDNENWGAPAQSNQAVTQEQKSAAYSAERYDRENRFGTDNWVETYFPEYSSVTTRPRPNVSGTSHGTGKPVGNDIMRVTAPWTSLGFRELWDSTPPDQRQALADSLNFYKNGGVDTSGNKIADPKTFNGLKYEGDTADGRHIFVNALGTLIGGQHPVRYGETSSNKRGFEYGVNAQWMGNDGTGFSPKYYHHVQQDMSPNRTYSSTGKFVPGFATTAQTLGLQRMVGNSDSRVYDRFMQGLSVGQNVGGAWGYMWDDAVVKRRQQMNSKHKKATIPTPQDPGYTPPPGQPGTPGGPVQPQPAPNAPGTGAPPKQPWEDDNSGAPPRGPVDYGPAPFDPYPSGYDPYHGNGYSGYGKPGSEYKDPQFGGPSQWGQLYNDWLAGGIDVSQYAPEMGGQSVAQTMSQEPAQGVDSGGYYKYYGQSIRGK